MDCNFFLSAVGRARERSLLRELFDAIGVDSSYALMAGGLPNPDVFAIKSAVLKLSDGSEVTMDEEETEVAMQYGKTAGLPDLRAFIEELTRRMHDPPTWKNLDPTNDPRTIVTAGAQDGIYKTLECLLDEGDVVLTSEPVYTAFLSCLIPYGVITEPVKMDKDGIIPESLRAVLSKYPKQTGNNKPLTRKIKLLYCVPNGDNPTGIRFTEDRKREVYRLAQEYNFLIMEDDAYYFLEERPLTQSFLSMDVDGRVLRLDTFSKTVGPGFRIGYLTGPPSIIQRVLCVAQVSSQGCSSMSQVVLWKLCQKWGIDGYLEHCERVYEFYSKRREMCLELAEKYLKDLAEWTPPTGGMFVWIKLRGLEDSQEFVMERLLKKRKVLVVAGAAFYPDLSAKSPYVRVSFSMVSREKMEKAFQIMAEELRQLQREQNGIANQA